VRVPEKVISTGMPSLGKSEHVEQSAKQIKQNGPPDDHLSGQEERIEKVVFAEHMEVWDEANEADNHKHHCPQRSELLVIEFRAQTAGDQNA